MGLICELFEETGVVILEIDSLAWITKVYYGLDATGLYSFVFVIDAWKGKFHPITKNRVVLLCILNLFQGGGLQQDHSRTASLCGIGWMHWIWGRGFIGTM